MTGKIYFPDAKAIDPGEVDTWPAHENGQHWQHDRRRTSRHRPRVPDMFAPEGFGWL